MASSPSARMSTGRTPQKKKKEPSPVEDDEELQASEEAGGEADEDGEYEIEYIVRAEQGLFKKKHWAYLVKWKNYGTKDNSWVKAEDFASKDLIQEFWSTKPNDKNNPYYDPKGRKSDTSRASLKGRKSNVGSDEEEPVKPNKRKASKEEVERTPSMEVDEDEPPKKKSKSAPVKSKKPVSNGVSQTEDEEEAKVVDEDENESDVRAHQENAMEKHMKKKNWEDLIGTIETVERSAEGPLLVYFTTTEGSKAICDSRILGQKAPHALLEFYETHLRWRGTSQVAA